jgi:hypothetical protein
VQHRFSGWPGAYCLNCGAPDPNEEALGHGCDRAVCKWCLKDYPMGDEPCLPERDLMITTGPNVRLAEGQPDSVPNHEIVFDSCGEHGSDNCYVEITVNES